MLSATPPLVSDVAAWFLAVGAILAVFTAVGKLFVNAMRRVIREEVPPAVADTFPDVTRAMIREEVSHVTEPMFAGLRAELKPNGGSSFSDLINRRLDAQDERLDALQNIADRIEDAT